MTISTGDLAKIQSIIKETTGENPDNLRYENGELLFSMNVGIEKTDEACFALVKAGLQNTPDDGKADYFKSGSTGSSIVNVSWPIDLDKPLWQ